MHFYICWSLNKKRLRDLSEILIWKGIWGMLLTTCHFLLGLANIWLSSTSHGSSDRQPLGIGRDRINCTYVTNPSQGNLTTMQIIPVLDLALFIAVTFEKQLLFNFKMKITLGCPCHWWHSVQKPCYDIKKCKRTIFFSLIKRITLSIRWIN